MKNLWSLSPIYKYHVIGRSMLPTYHEGDILLVNRIGYLISQPKTDDCIVLKDPRSGREILKRITKVTNKGYFVEGDNRNESTDSRTFGEITKKVIVGKVIVSLS